MPGSLSLEERRLEGGKASLYPSLDKATEQGVAFERAGGELWMKLHPDKPGMITQLDCLDQSAVRRETAKNHALGSEEFTVGVVELIPMAMAFGYFFLRIQAQGQTLVGQNTGVGAESHGAPLCPRSRVAHP